MKALKLLPVLICIPTVALAQKFGPQIIDGADAKPESIVSRSTIAIQMPQKQDGTWSYPHCTSFMIGKNLLMTAAHCLAFLSDKTTVHAILSLDPKFGADAGGQTRIGIADYRLNPNYYADNSGVYNDVAILRLKSDLPDYYIPLKINWNADQTLVKNMSLIVAGFGTTSDFGQPDDLPPRLRYTNVPFVGGNKSDISSSDQILVDQTQAGFCSGDSGGPLYVLT